LVGWPGRPIRPREQLAADAAGGRGAGSGSTTGRRSARRPCWTGRRHYGDADVGGWIATHRPDLVLAGHVHESPFKPEGSWADRIGTTWVFNAGRQIGPVPCHVEIDLAQETASWRSMMGTESLSLAAAQAPARTVF
jgi:hypothetical protein